MAWHKVFRRDFLGVLPAFFLGTVSADARESSPSQPSSKGEFSLPEYACAQDYRSLKQSSYDRTGGNADSWPIAPGATKEVFNSAGPGVITHIWFTINAQSTFHLKEIVLRMYWDGESKPSVEVPIGDFFGLNLGEYNLYQSAFLNCSSVKGLNCYFAMPFRKSARITVTNEGSRPDRQLLFQHRLSTRPELAGTKPLLPCAISPGDSEHGSEVRCRRDKQLNLDGKENYVFGETHGRGHLMGVTLGVLQNQERWMGEGDDMIFIDDDKDPSINGTGTEDYFCGAWDFGGRGASAVPFANLYNGAHVINAGEEIGGRYCLYRWHADNPVTFRKYLKYTMEHGHANNRADCFYSVCYWYQTEPYTDFPSSACRSGAHSDNQIELNECLEESGCRFVCNPGFLLAPVFSKSWAEVFMKASSGVWLGLFAMCFLGRPATASHALRRPGFPEVAQYSDHQRAQTIPPGRFAPIGLLEPGARAFHPYSDLPAFCRVMATLKPSSDSDIKMQLWMPASKWNGKLEGLGNGGWAGMISIKALAVGLSMGYAVTSTDTGHSEPNGSFAVGHPEKVIDFDIGRSTR